MVDPSRDLPEGEGDQALIPFRQGDAIFQPGNAGKIPVIGAVAVIDRDMNQSNPRARPATHGTPNTSTRVQAASALP